jgi:hypothetical protein
MNQQELLKYRNSDWSILLIVINIILLFIYMNVGYLKNSLTSVEKFLWLSVSMNVLLGFYAFSYHGEKYQLGKVFFILLSIFNVIYFSVLWIASKSFRI